MDELSNTKPLALPLNRASRCRPRGVIRQMLAGEESATYSSGSDGQTQAPSTVTNAGWRKLQVSVGDNAALKNLVQVAAHTSSKQDCYAASRVSGVRLEDQTARLGETRPPAGVVLAPAPARCETADKSLHSFQCRIAGRPRRHAIAPSRIRANQSEHCSNRHRSWNGAAAG